MTTTQALEYLREQMDRLLIHYWDADLMSRRAYRSYGRCYFRKRLIVLNPNFVEMAPDDEVKDVCLHEIAHAIEYERHGTAGHGPRWKAICREIGANPERLYQGDVHVEKTMQRKAGVLYKLVHKETGKVYATRLRRPKDMTSDNWYIKRDKKNTLGKLEWRKVNQC